MIQPSLSAKNTLEILFDSVNYGNGEKLPNMDFGVFENLKKVKLDVLKVIGKETDGSTDKTSTDGWSSTITCIESVKKVIIQGPVKKELLELLINVPAKETAELIFTDVDFGSIDGRIISDIYTHFSYKTILAIENCNTEIFVERLESIQYMVYVDELRIIDTETVLLKFEGELEKLKKKIPKLKKLTTSIKSDDVIRNWPKLMVVFEEMLKKVGEIDLEYRFVDVTDYDQVVGRALCPGKLTNEILPALMKTGPVLKCDKGKFWLSKK